MSESCLIEKITNAENELKKNCIRYSEILIIANCFSITALIMLCFTDELYSNIAFGFIAGSGIITSIIVVKLIDMQNEIRQLNSKIIVKLNNNKQEVN